MSDRNNIKRKLDNLYGKNYTCDDVKNHIEFSSESKFETLMNKRKRNYTIISILSIVFLCAICSLLSLCVDRRIRSDQVYDEETDIFNEYNNLYDVISGSPVIQVKIERGSILRIYEGMKDEEKVYFFSIDKNTQENNSKINISKIIINGSETTVNNTEVKGYIGKVTEVNVLVYTKEEILEYNFVL